jgi:hypothetical protein
MTRTCFRPRGQDRRDNQTLGYPSLGSAANRSYAGQAWLRHGRLADARSALVGCPPRPADWWPLAGDLAAEGEVVAAYRVTGDGEFWQA